MQGLDAARWYEERREQALELVDQYRALLEEIRAHRAEIEQEEAGARVELAGAYLPSLTPGDLARQASLTGFKGFERRDPNRAMAHEAQVLSNRIAQIRLDDSYVRRTYLVGPVGEYTRAREEAASMLAPWQETCGTYEVLEGFDDLIACKYDTPEYRHDWWAPQYWRRWANGDAICKAVGVGDFGDDILPTYLPAAAERDKWKEEVARWDGRIGHVHELTREHDVSVARIPRLPEIYLDDAHRVLGDFIEHADIGLLDEWCRAEESPDRAIRMGLRRVSGLRAKIAFLEELAESGVLPALESFTARAEKYGRKVIKYQRSKHMYRTITRSELDLGFVTKRPKYLGRLDKVRKLLGRIRSYDDYERFDLANDPQLWWVEMTRKQPNSMTPRLRRWYDSHGHVRPRYDDSLVEREIAESLAEAAAAASAADDLGYLS